MIYHAHGFSDCTLLSLSHHFGLLRADLIHSFILSEFNAANNLPPTPQENNTSPRSTSPLSYPSPTLPHNAPLFFPLPKMSTAASSYPDIPTAAATSSHSSFLSSFSSLGLGYSIAITVGLLLLVSALLISSYICYRRRRRAASTSISSNPSPGSTLPRIIFVSEDESDEENHISAHACSPTGLDPAAIGSYPKFPFSAKNGGETTCSICLCEYREAEMLRMLPDCRHYFHLMCIDAWLRLNASCPVCRTSPMPTPLSTPLSEVVPLSQFAADRRRR
jgi:Ring finger domain